MHRAAWMGFAVGLLLGGCYRTHMRGEDAGSVTDGAMIDARALDAPALDAPLDAPIDEATRCECCPGVSILSRPGFACAAACAGVCMCADRQPAVVCFRAPVADAPTDVEVQVPQDECYCGQALGVLVRGARGRDGAHQPDLSGHRL